MIWAGGRVLADDALSVGITDRVLEHGLGLFETFRTWGGRPRLLGRHLLRMERSARALGLPIDEAALPDADAVAALLRAESVEADAALRLTLTGGAGASGGSVLWMHAGPLPPPNRRGGAVVALAAFEVSWGDPLARHKTLNYWSRRRAYERALADGADEALLRSPDGRIWEGSRTSLFVVRGGALRTPGLDGPLVPGVMRELVVQRARAIGIAVAAEAPDAAQLDLADEVFLTNAIRGIVPVGRTPSNHALVAPGPLTRRIAAEVARWIDAGEAGGP